MFLFMQVLETDVICHFISIQILKLMRALHLFISRSHRQLPGPLCSQLQFQRCVLTTFFTTIHMNMFSANAWHFYFIVYRHRLHSLQLGNQQARHLPRYVSTHHFGLFEVTFKHKIPFHAFAKTTSTLLTNFSQPQDPLRFPPPALARLRQISPQPAQHQRLLLLLALQLMR